MAEQVLIVGSGGREHAVARQLAASPRRPHLWAAPGNPGVCELATEVPIPPDDQAGLAAFCRARRVDTVVIGPEDPLIAGLADRLRTTGGSVFGPGAEGARLEGDKEFAKELLEAAGVPTAPYAAFSNRDAALAYLGQVTYPVVIKATGAAQGKGVAVCADRAAAEAHLDLCFLRGRFGAAGRRVLIETCLTGPELSVFAVTDGEDHALLAPARDHKRAFDGDQGPNTGGMGAFAPVALADPTLYATINDRVIAPTLAELRRQGIRYRGVLYAGLMLTPTGPQVLEFNCRFGDPEAQVVLPLLRGDFLELMRAAAEGRLGAYLATLPPPGPGAPAGWPGAALTHWGRACVVVVGAAAGYPGEYAKGTPLRVPPQVGPDAWFIHAGTRRENGQLVTSGGRVLGAVGQGGSLDEARERAYGLLRRVECQGLHYRRDIGGAAPARHEEEA